MAYIATESSHRNQHPWSPSQAPARPASSSALHHAHAPAEYDPASTPRAFPHAASSRSSSSQGNGAGPGHSHSNLTVDEGADVDVKPLIGASLPPASHSASWSVYSSSHSERRPSQPTYHPADQQHHYYRPQAGLPPPGPGAQTPSQTFSNTNYLQPNSAGLHPYAMNVDYTQPGQPGHASGPYATGEQQRNRGISDVSSASGTTGSSSTSNQGPGMDRHRDRSHMDLAHQTNLNANSQWNQPQRNSIQKSASFNDIHAAHSHTQIQAQAPEYNYGHRDSVTSSDYSFAGPDQFQTFPSPIPPLPSESGDGDMGLFSKRPALSLSTDDRTLFGAYTQHPGTLQPPEQLRRTNSHSTDGESWSSPPMNQPSLTFSAAPSVSSPNTISSAHTEPRDVPYSNSLHPAGDDRTRSSAYLEHRHGGTSPAMSSAGSDSRSHSPFGPPTYPDPTRYQQSETTPLTYGRHEYKVPPMQMQHDMNQRRSPNIMHSTQFPPGPAAHRGPFSVGTGAPAAGRDERQLHLPSMAGFNLSEQNTQNTSQAIQSWTRLPRRPDNEAEAQAILRPYIAEYLDTTNRMILGERTIVIMSTTVGQKSYGSERRFLVPPPSAYILGCSWWTHLPDAYVPSSHAVSMGAEAATQLFAPAIHVEMECEQKAFADPSVEWTTYSGAIADKIGSANDFPVAGRAVAKQLYIPDAKERDLDGSKQNVSAVVTIVSPGLGGPGINRTIGSFSSKPIRVISKPSKKAQTNKKGGHIVTHGSTVALFNRLRSQTVSTRFLCVSSAAASFPQWDWQAMTGQESKPFADDRNSCFTAWDSFVIYAVDPRRPPISEEEEPQQPPQLGYPHPPANALPIPTTGAPMNIYYNQPIVLQCLNTAVVSPVMIIRKVDKGNMASGGGNHDGPVTKPLYEVPVAPGERLGDAVSQLHKIALEVVADPVGAYNAPLDLKTGFLGGGSYLSCLGENVGIRKAETTRIPVGGDSASGESAHPGHLEAMIAGQATALAQRDDELARSRSESVSMDCMWASNDGGRVKKLRKSSNSVSSPIQAPVKGRKRGASFNAATALSEHAENGESVNMDGLWLQDAGEAGVWTIASTEISRHSFYVPPVCFDGLTPFKCRATGAPACFLTPIPNVPLTNVPFVRKYIVNQQPNFSANARHPVQPSRQRTITLYGENLGPQWTVWFGDIPSPGRTPSICTEVLECLEPQDESIDPLKSRQILLVRTDGVIVPSHIFWTP